MAKTIMNAQTLLVNETAQGQSLAAIEIDSLTKRYGDVAAVENLQLQVAKGTLFGFLGPNGAGKSTTIRCLTGIEEPTSGTIRLLGMPLTDHVAAVRQIGVMPESLALFEQLYASEFLLFQASMFGLPAAEARRRVDELLEALELSGAGRRRMADFSAGMRKKVSFAAALIHSPSILFLDEPFESIDPKGVALMKRWLRDFVSTGRTVFLTSHVLDIVERLCDEVAIINGGRLTWRGPVAEESLQGGLEWQGRRFHSLETLFLEITGQSDASPEWL